MNRWYVLLYGMLLLAGVSRVAAQETSAPASLRLFLDCDVCDGEYFRRELDFVDHVRDRTVADVHVLVTGQDTGAGGRSYTLDFIGLRRFAGRADTLLYTAPDQATDDERRSGLARMLKLGLVPYVLGTAAADRLDLTVRPPAAAEAQQPVHDPWHLWFFSTGLRGSLEGESRQFFGGLNAELEGDRVTLHQRTSFEAEGNWNRSEFDIDDSTRVTSDAHEWELSGLHVRSLGARWSGGAGVCLDSATVSNQRTEFRFAPAIEFSFFPYAESSRRLFTVTYMIGGSVRRYYERTIYDVTAETLVFEALSTSYEATQPWGSARGEIEASHFLHDPWGKYRFEVHGGADIRLRRGLSLDFGVGLSYVRDQLSLPQAGLPPEEILLQRRQLATNYRYSTSVGLSYSFGSIFNNVVNPRLREF